MRKLLQKLTAPVRRLFLLVAAFFTTPKGPLLLALAAILGLSGCTPAVERSGDSAAAPVSVAAEPYRVVLAIPLDVSGSMASDMKPDGKGTLFANSTVSHFQHAGMGENDLLIISQLSGNRQSIVWQGAPRMIREDHSRFADLGDAVIKASDPNGSRIWDGLSDVMELMMSDPRIWNAKTKVALIAVTDMENTLVDNYSSERRLKDNLKAWAKHGAILGIYLCGNQETVRWRKNLAEAGFKPNQFAVEPRAESKPRIPSFE